MPPFPDTLQINHYFATLAVFLSPLSQFLEGVGSLPFPEPENLLPSQGLSTFSCLHLYVTLPLHLIGISPQRDLWRGLPWFSFIIQKYLLLLAPAPFSSCRSPCWDVCALCCHFCWLPHWNVSSMKAYLPALFTLLGPSTKRGPGT